MTVCKPGEEQDRVGGRHIPVYQRVFVALEMHHDFARCLLCGIVHVRPTETPEGGGKTVVCEYARTEEGPVLSLEQIDVERKSEIDPREETRPVWIGELQMSLFDVFRKIELEHPAEQQPASIVRGLIVEPKLPPNLSVSLPWKGICPVRLIPKDCAAGLVEFGLVADGDRTVTRSTVRCSDMGFGLGVDPWRSIFPHFYDALVHLSIHANRIQKKRWSGDIEQLRNFRLHGTGTS
ncbi:hypothetical protein XH90_09300 [Bradyrhizobium sp. CCBAU 53338]|nr:hypothetical protein XH90_09300 [Bradyrhizobium sp. CCBAU 53338]